MKKMIDVFNGKPCGFSPRMTDEQARYGQRAINHVDALADALEAMLKTPRGTSGRIILEKEDEDAVRAALAAYRGKS